MGLRFRIYDFKGLGDQNLGFRITVRDPDPEFSSQHNPSDFNSLDFVSNPKLSRVNYSLGFRVDGLRVRATSSPI